MLGFLNWWRRWRASSRRNLFEFFDGRRFRKADPWPIYSAIFDDPEFLIGKDRDDPTDMLENSPGRNSGIKSRGKLPPQDYLKSKSQEIPAGKSRKTPTLKFQPRKYGNRRYGPPLIH
jgi:hypothetical protein